MTSNLRNGHTKTCGECGYQEQRTADARTTHGHSVGGKPTREYVMYLRAKDRAKAKGLPFDIDIEDIVIPSHCPVLGWVLEHGEGILQPNSPSLDRILPEMGYVKGNIWVISHKANSIKSDSILDELEAVASALRKKLDGDIQPNPGI